MQLTQSQTNNETVVPPAKLQRRFHLLFYFLFIKPPNLRGSRFQMVTDPGPSVWVYVAQFKASEVLSLHLQHQFHSQLGSSDSQIQVGLHQFRHTKHLSSLRAQSVHFKNQMILPSVCSSEWIMTVLKWSQRNFCKPIASSDRCCEIIARNEWPKGA